MNGIIIVVMFIEMRASKTVLQQFVHFEHFPENVFQFLFGSLVNPSGRKWCTFQKDEFSRTTQRIKLKSHHKNPLGDIIFLNDIK